MLCRMRCTLSDTSRQLGQGFTLASSLCSPLMYHIGRILFHAGESPMGMKSIGSVVETERENGKTMNMIKHVDSSEVVIPMSSLAHSLAHLPDYQPVPVNSTEFDNSSGDHTPSSVHPAISLAKSLACLPELAMPVDSTSARQMKQKRLIEIHIKKRVKQQYMNGKYFELFRKVVADPQTLKDAYDSIRLASDVPLTIHDDLCFTYMAEQLISGSFNVKDNTIRLSRMTRRREVLVLPKLKLKVVKEAIRIVLEVVYRPHFSKISHGCRSGRGHNSALQYICKEVRNADWLFTLLLNQKIDANVLNKLVSLMEEKIEDKHLFSILHQMFDAEVLNIEFGRFPKGQGLPQEGILSPVLMNIYLDLFDKQLYKLRMRYEGLGCSTVNLNKRNEHSKLRCWFRRQLKADNEDLMKSDILIWACRYMDEIFVAVSGPKDVAFNLKSEAQNYLKDELGISVEDRAGVISADSPSGVQFLGVTIRAFNDESNEVRAVHKLKDKVHKFAMQMQEVWDYGTVRMGKKWLAHALKKVKESEIKHLADQNLVLSQISQFRKDGMKTEHWFKFLLKVWVQDIGPTTESSKEEVLVKYIVEPALPLDLKDSFCNFQKQAQMYVSSETNATLELIANSGREASLSRGSHNAKIRAFIPIDYVKKSLMRYGLVNRRGYPQRAPALILQDNNHIIDWFSGLTSRWLKWYTSCQNFAEVKFLVAECLRKSCVRTLASKHRIHESNIEKKLEDELSHLPSTEEFDPDMETMRSVRISGHDEALMYGTCNSGLCMLSLAKLRDALHPSECYVTGCRVISLGSYSLIVNEQQRFPGWRTGFATAIHPSLNRRLVSLCKKHVVDLYMGRISLQAVDFSVLQRR